MKIYANVMFSPFTGLKFEVFTTQEGADAHLRLVAEDILGDDHPLLRPGEWDGCKVLIAIEEAAGQGYFFDQLTNDLQTEFNEALYNTEPSED